MMTMLLHALLLTFLSASMASVIFTGGGQNYCDGLICPPDTGCSVVSNSVNGKQITKKTCTNATGHVVKQEITEGIQISQAVGTTFFSHGNKFCLISNSTIGDKTNTTKLCREGDGEFRPMTPEEEVEYDKQLAEAAEHGRRMAEHGRRVAENARAMARRWQQEAMSWANEARRFGQQEGERGRQIGQEAAERGRRIGQEAAEYGRWMGQLASKNARQLAERLAAAAQRREARLEAAEREREAKQEDLERRLEEKQIRLEKQQEEREWRMKNHFDNFDSNFPNFVDEDEWWN